MLMIIVLLQQKHVKQNQPEDGAHRENPRAAGEGGSKCKASVFVGGRRSPSMDTQ